MADGRPPQYLIIDEPNERAQRTAKAAVRATKLARALHGARFYPRIENLLIDANACCCWSERKETSILPLPPHDNGK